MKIKTSPIRYIGGKYLALKAIRKYIPYAVKEVASPFFGGGGIEINLCMGAGIRVRGYDIHAPLIDFWRAVLEDSKKLADLIYEKYYPADKLIFSKLITQIHDKSLSVYERGAIFFVLNRTSYGGLGWSYCQDKFGFNLVTIQKLRNFRIDKLTVDYMDFKDSIKESEDIFLYCDPPYPLQDRRLYRVRGGAPYTEFDHEGLADILRGREKWILSYNDNEYIRDLYKEFRIVKPKWRYCLGQRKESHSEVLILSDDISNYTQHTLVGVN